MFTKSLISMVAATVLVVGLTGNTSAHAQEILVGCIDLPPCSKVEWNGIFPTVKTASQKTCTYIVNGSPVQRTFCAW